MYPLPLLPRIIVNEADQVEVQVPVLPYLPQHEFPRIVSTYDEDPSAPPDSRYPVLPE